MIISPPSRPARLLWAAATLSAMTLATTTAAASAAPATGPVTVYVDGASAGGRCSDGYTAAQAESPSTPWCTISTAAGAVPAGSVINVEPGTYHETVTLTPLDNGVTVQAGGASRPIIDGDGLRSSGIVLAGSVHNVTINGFEIRNTTSSASGRATGIVGYDTNTDVIENNVIHDIHSANAYSYGIVLGTNQTPGVTHDVTVRGNRIYNIGPGGESMGIWMLMTKNMTLTGNEIYLVRKEGIRDWYGLDNTFTGNRLYLNWIGITLESATGAYVANNVAYANVWGYNPKHVSESSAVTMWNLPAGQWSKFWHNTSYANTHADIALGMNAPIADFIDVRDNVFASPGDVHIHDFPADRSSNIIVDGNVYSGSAPASYAGWDASHTPVYKTVSALQSATGWEIHGQSFTPQFRNPQAGDFSFSAAGMAPGVALPDAYGAQLGASGVPPATMKWTHYAATVVASTPEPTYLATASQRAADGSDDTYWWSSNYNTNASVTFDLGSPQSINTFVLDLYSNLDPRSPKDLTIQVSGDNVNYTTVQSVSNPDSEGSSYKYTLAAPLTARYVRLNLLTGFGGSTLLFSDFAVGLLSPTGTAPPGANIVPLATHAAAKPVAPKPAPKVIRKSPRSADAKAKAKRSRSRRRSAAPRRHRTGHRH